MRALGLTLLTIGFLWIGWDVAGGFVMYQYTHWIWRSKRLPATVTRDEASSAMRDLSISLKDRHQVVFLPASLMFTGGLIAAFSSRKIKEGDEGTPRTL
jgi:hypothetical protein